MKILVTIIISCILLTGCSQMESEFNDRMDKLEKRIENLEQICSEMNQNINSLKTIIDAIQQNDFVTSITPIMEDGEEIGFTITFSKSGTIKIYNGRDGIDGEDGYTPVIGASEDTDGIYYWTLDGKWMLDKEGNKIPAQISAGTDGKDGITPLLKIENDFWWISYDEGKTWEELGKATGENGDSFFRKIDTSNPEYVVFILADGTELKLPLASSSLLTSMQSVKFLPEFDDEKINFRYSIMQEEKAVAEYTFKIFPESCLDILETHWSELLSMKGFYSQALTASTQKELIDLSILEFAADATDGTFTVKVSGENIHQCFVDDSLIAMTFLKISDGERFFVSENIPVRSTCVPDEIDTTAEMNDFVGTYTLYCLGEMTIGKTLKYNDRISDPYVREISISIDDAEAGILLIDGWIPESLTNGISVKIPVWYGLSEKDEGEAGGHRLKLINQIVLGEKDENGYAPVMYAIVQEDSPTQSIFFYNGNFCGFEISRTANGLRFDAIPMNGRYKITPFTYALLSSNLETNYYTFYNEDPVPAGPYTAVKTSDTPLPNPEI